MLEARHFTILTDHKPLTFAFHQKRNKCSPRQFNHLDFISQFTTDIRHISSQDNIVADALSRVEQSPRQSHTTCLPQPSSTTTKCRRFW
jgi:cleavage and polyadenylation specificity factor subunit 1